ncbi:MAG: hypothetical protein Q7T65_09785 [Thiobacillus sp.]|nr:hypothetical protein [Thiobacillus sp.]
MAQVEDDHQHEYHLCGQDGIHDQLRLGMRLGRGAGQFNDNVVGGIQRGGRMKTKTGKDKRPVDLFRRIAYRIHHGTVPLPGLVQIPQKPGEIVRLIFDDRRQLPHSKPDLVQLRFKLGVQPINHLAILAFFQPHRLEGNFLAYIAQAAAFIDDACSVGGPVIQPFDNDQVPHRERKKQQKCDAKLFAKGGAQQPTTQGIPGMLDRDGGVLRSGFIHRAFLA